MAKKYVYQKSETGVTDFVYIDLLPEIKSIRQFNFNVIVALLTLVTLSFIFIYIPYRSATVEYEDLNGLNNDLKHDLTLTNEEVTAYAIDRTVISFEEDIETIEGYQINFNNYIDDLVLVTQLRGGRISRIAYNSDSNMIEIDVAIVTPFLFNILNNEIIELDWTNTSSYSTPERFNGEVEYQSTYEIEVDVNVE